MSFKFVIMKKVLFLQNPQFCDKRLRKGGKKVKFCEILDFMAKICDFRIKKGKLLKKNDFKSLCQNIAKFMFYNKI